MERLGARVDAALSMCLARSLAVTCLLAIALIAAPCVHAQFPAPPATPAPPVTVAPPVTTAPPATTAPVSPAPLPRSVHVVLAACPLYDAAELAVLLRTELGALGIENVVLTETEPGAATLAQNLAVLRVACADAPELVAVQLADLASGKALEREVLVADVEAKARSRLIAMTAAGLLESSWLELAVDPSTGHVALPDGIRKALRLRVRDALFPSQPEPASPDPTPLLPAELAAPHVARHYLQLMGMAEAFPARSTGLAGIGLGYARPFGDRFRAWVDVDGQLGVYELSQGGHRVGSVRLQWFTAGLGLAWVSASVPSLAVGPFLRAGFASATGEVDASDSTVTPTNANDFVSVLGLRGQLDAPLSDRVSVLVALDGGYMPSGVAFVALDQRPAGMAEVALALRLGVSLTP